MFVLLTLPGCGGHFELKQFGYRYFYLFIMVSQLWWPTLICLAPKVN